jgi:hypothetical protein
LVVADGWCMKDYTTHTPRFSQLWVDLNSVF